MAEFCLDCFIKELMPNAEEKIIVGNEYCRCEGCGQIKQFVVKTERKPKPIIKTFDRVEEMINFFYANKHLYERMMGKADPIRLEFFVEKICNGCGTQRCEPYNKEWRDGCPEWKAFDKLTKTGE